MLTKASAGINKKVAQRVAEQLISSDPDQVAAAIRFTARQPQLMDALRRTEWALTRIAAGGGQ